MFFLYDMWIRYKMLLRVLSAYVLIKGYHCTVSSFVADCRHQILIVVINLVYLKCSSAWGHFTAFMRPKAWLPGVHTGYSWLLLWEISGSGCPILECGSKGSHIHGHPGMLGMGVFESGWIKIIKTFIGICRELKEELGLLFF